MQEQVQEKIRDMVYTLISKDGLSYVIHNSPFSIYLKGMKYVVTVKGDELEINITMRQENISSTER